VGATLDIAIPVFAPCGQGALMGEALLWVCHGDAISSHDQRVGKMTWSVESESTTVTQLKGDFQKF
jgi:hypothetical protein